MKIAEAAEIILKDVSTPMHARDIAAAIAAKKLFEFKTNDTVSVVSKALRQSDRFKKTGPGVFELCR